jgi:MFS family permease
MRIEPRTSFFWCSNIHPFPVNFAGEDRVNHSQEKARYTLFVLFAINLLNFYDRHIFGALAAPIRKEWSLSDSQIGWLATAFTLLYAVVGLPLGRLSDRWKRPHILSGGIAVWSLLTAASGIAWNYGSMFAARLGVGVGEAACAPAANALIGDLYPAARRARALAYFTLGLPFGNFLGTYVSGYIASVHGWRIAFYIAGLPGLLLAILAMTLQDPARGAAEISPSAGRPFTSSSWSAPLAAVLGIRTMRSIIVTGALFNFNAYALATYMPLFLQRYHSLDLRQSTFVSAVTLGLTGVPGLLLGGWAADRAHAVRANGRLLLCLGSAFLTALCIFLALNLAPGSVVPFALLLGTGCMVGYIYYTAVYATIQDLVPPSLRGTAMALYFLAMYLTGASFGPVVTGKLSDYFARAAMTAAGAGSLNDHFRAVGLHSAMYVVPLCSALLGGVLFFATRTVSKDMHALQVWMSAPHGSQPTLGTGK